MKDRSEYVAANAAAALWRIARHPAALPALEAVLKSDDSMARISAVKALAEIGPEAVAVVPALRTSVRDRDADVRREARAALPRITGLPLSEAELPGATRVDEKKVSARTLRNQLLRRQQFGVGNPQGEVGRVAIALL